MDWRIKKIFFLHFLQSNTFILERQMLVVILFVGGMTNPYIPPSNHQAILSLLSTTNEGRGPKGAIPL